MESNRLAALEQYESATKNEVNSNIDLPGQAYEDEYADRSDLSSSDKTDDIQNEKLDHRSKPHSPQHSSPPSIHSPKDTADRDISTSHKFKKPVIDPSLHTQNSRYDSKAIRDVDSEEEDDLIDELISPLQEKDHQIEVA